ncbi:MAG: glycoside hydrolase family 130 protein [Spirochaetales bacterium]|nr:glycoside hydrolase family 130 protein [Spirochaetales bacterium]
MAITVSRKENKFYPDSKRVITRFYMPGGDGRGEFIIKKVMALSEDEVKTIFTGVLRDFTHRHRNITKVFNKHFGNIVHILENLNIIPDSLSKEKRLLIGSYFSHEYSIESAAFFNPSIVEDPDQASLEDGEKRIIVSFRATGEGHISSIVFRSGIINKNNELIFKPINYFVEQPEIIRIPEYDKEQFLEKLEEMDIHKDIVDLVMARLGAKFTYNELQNSIHECVKDVKLSYSKKNVIQSIVWLAHASYEITFSLNNAISERVIFPVSDSEKNGIEDARFVRFTDYDGKIIYYATFTAYNGYAILPKIMETEDFYHFRVTPLLGKCAQNKGMALFPRMINGRYAMISRLDGYRNYIMYSDIIHEWQHAELLEEPEYPWEFVQIGNCGSPIETEKGWLLVTHGVGPMRKYCLGATLLDLQNPAKVIGKLDEPLLIPNDEEREGYVPNVVYSCGAIIHNNELIISYAMSDSASSFVSVSLDVLFAKLT